MCCIVALRMWPFDCLSAGQASAEWNAQALWESMGMPVVPEILNLMLAQWHDFVHLFCSLCCCYWACLQIVTSGSSGEGLCSSSCFFVVVDPQCVLLHLKSSCRCHIMYLLVLCPSLPSYPGDEPDATTWPRSQFLEVSRKHAIAEQEQECENGAPHWNGDTVLALT